MQYIFQTNLDIIQIKIYLGHGILINKIFSYF